MEHIAIFGLSLQAWITIITVIGIFVVMAGLMQTGVLHWLTKHLLGNPSNLKQAIIKLTIPIASLAALLNSVNVVALFIDVVKIWAKKLSIEPSRLLIPLSYAATLGGTCTLIGNSSNLVISGLYAEQTTKDLAPLNDCTGHDIIIDCTNLEYISSSGLRILLNIRKNAAAVGSKVTILNINDEIQKVFMMTGFSSLFDVQNQ